MDTQVAVPAALEQPVAEALAWVNATQGRAYELTGLVDYEAAQTAPTGTPYEMGQVLCDGELCAREQIRVTPVDSGFEFSFVTAGERDIPPLLDPPEGVRRAWLDEVIGKHEFVLLLFYRGLW